jgi:flagellar biosynthesis protein
MGVWRFGAAAHREAALTPRGPLAVADKTPSLDIPPESPRPAGRGPERQPVAIAIEHDVLGRGGPKITAKGRGAVAEQILQIAFDRGIKVRSDADLAEILEAVEVDSIVPLEALAAVAEILSYVYRAQGDPGSDLGAEKQP